MMERTHEELKSLIAAYVLGAVPADEIPLVRSHILSCEECMAEADGYSEVTAALTLAAQPEPPPKGFEERVMAAAIEAPPRQAPRPRSVRRWSLLPVASYVALSLAVAVLGLGFLDARYDLRRDQKILTSMLHSDQGFELRGQSGAVARVVPTAAGATFVATGLQQAPDAHTYQLWLMRDQQPVSAGTFEASEGLVILEMERSLEGFDRAAVTIEPEGGSREPTSPPVIQSA